MEKPGSVQKRAGARRFADKAATGRGRCEMRRLIVSVLSAAAGAAPAAAADWYTGVKSSEPDYSNNIVLDASLTATTKGSKFVDVSVTVAPQDSLEKTGLRVRADGMLGEYKYKTDKGVPITARQEQASVMGGYEWVSRNFTYAVYAGISGQNDTLSPADPSNSVQGKHIGLKVSGEFYDTRRKNTLLMGYASFSTNASSYYVRLKYGWMVGERVYMGPEIMAMGNTFYQQWRAGVHLTGWKMGPVQLGVSGGYLSDAKLGSGLYTVVDARVGF